MDGIPPALPTDSEDIAWALETAEALWKRGERVDAVVWVRRAAQAAGEGEDAKRAAVLARYAAELGDWIGSHTITGEAIEGQGQSDRAREGVDALLGGSSGGVASGDVVVLSARDMEVVSARDFEAGFGPPKAPGGSGAPQALSDGEVMTVSLHAPDVEVFEDAASVEEFPEEEPTPVLRHLRSPVPDAGVPSAAQAHAGMLDPWAAAERARRESGQVSVGRAGGGRPTFDEEEVVTSAKRNAGQPPRLSDEEPAVVPRAPKPPRLPPPRGRAPAAPPPEEPDTTTYKQINPRAGRPDAPPAQPPAPSRAAPPAQPKPAPRGPLARPPRAPPPEKPATAAPRAKPEAPVEPIPPTKPATITKPASDHPRESSSPPALDLLEMVDSVSLPEPPPPAPEPQSARPTIQPSSGSPTAPPPSSMPPAAIPSGAPTRPHAGETLLDLTSVEALSDLPDDAREDFARAAKMHKIATNEEVSTFALALVVEGEIDVSAQIVDAPALRLVPNAILRSRGTITPGVSLRLVCASPSALIATWDAAAVEAAFRSCPWVEDDLRAVTDKVQAKAGMTMGPLGDRFDQFLRDHFVSKLTIRSLAPGEVLVAQGKPAPIAVVGIGEILVTKAAGGPAETLREGDFVFPTQTLAHAPAPATAAAGPGGAVVLYGDRAVAQELLMSFPPLLEVLATL